MGLAAGLISAFLVAFSNVLVRDESDRMDMFTLNALRLMAAAPVALAIPWLVWSSNNVGLYPITSIIYVVLAALVGIMIGDAVYYKSQMILGVAHAQPIANTSPIFTMIMAIVFLEEKPTCTLVFSIVLVIGGVYLLSGNNRVPVTEKTIKSSSSLLLGVGLALGAGVLWATGTILAREGLVGIDVAQANQLRIPIVALVMAGTARFNRGPFGVRHRGWRSLSKIAAAGILGVSIGNLLFVYNLQENGATVAALTSSLSALFAAPLAIMFLGERVTWRTLAGMICCLGAIWLVLATVSFS